MESKSNQELMADTQSFLEKINWNSDKNLSLGGNIFIPTIVSSESGEILGLAYSTRESLERAIKEKKGIYFSRTRASIWEKSPTMRNRQVLLEVKVDCDGDSLVFVVEQRGEFCHVEGHRSCFSTNLTLSKKRPTKICYATGKCESISFDFLKMIGIQVFTPHSRAKNFQIQSKMGNFELISWKPKDIELCIDKADFILYYKEFMKKEAQDYIDSEFIVLRSENPFKPMRVSLVASKEMGIKTGKTYSEYPQLDIGTPVVPIHGNGEEYVKNGFCDSTVVIVSTGKTIKDVGLSEVKTVCASDLSLMIRKSFYLENPRLCREIRNSLHPNTIYFYSVDGKYGPFSNFYPCLFVDSQGRSWSSSEHYYQAHKFEDPESFDMIRNIPTCKECYKTAWKHSHAFRKDWPMIKDQIMMQALVYKYTQNEEFKKLLLETGTKNLVEHSMRDVHYGMGLESDGKNQLGILLVKLREMLRPRL